MNSTARCDDRLMAAMTAQMLPAQVPSPLGWCADCLAMQRNTVAMTMWDGFGLCARCANVRLKSRDAFLQSDDGAST
jgi:hypothetical protein